jgi:hypothetical protein
MSDIYEQKTKKYKYKYLKLKQELLGGAGDAGDASGTGDAISNMSLCQLLNLNKIKKSIHNNQYEYHFHNIYLRIREEIDINNLKKHIKSISDLQNNLPTDLIKRKKIHMLLGQKIHDINNRINMLKKIKKLNLDQLNLAVVHSDQNNYLKAIKYNLNNETDIEEINKDLIKLQLYDSKTNTNTSLRNFLNDIINLINIRINKLVKYNKTLQE